MLNWIIDFTLKHRGFILIGALVIVGVGGYALYTIPVEAFPDLTNNQVVIVTEAPSLPPTEVEQLVTYPIERAMLGCPKKERYARSRNSDCRWLRADLTVRCRCDSGGS